jgi:hypothetical protein
LIDSGVAPSHRIGQRQRLDIQIVLGGDVQDLPDEAQNLRHRNIVIEIAAEGGRDGPAPDWDRQALAHGDVAPLLLDVALGRAVQIALQEPI